MAENPVRPCYGCQVFDDAPRHEIALPGGQSAPPFHLDCCAQRRDCAVCKALIAGAAPGTVGGAMRAHLEALPPMRVEHVENDDSADPHNMTTAIVTEA